MNSKKYKIINIKKIIPLNSYFILNPDFQSKIFHKAIKTIGSEIKLSKRIGKSRSACYLWKTCKIATPLNIILKIANIINLSEDEIYQNTKKIRTKLKRGEINPKLNLELNPELAEWFGLLIGDGSVSKKNTNCSNNSLDLIYFFNKIIEERFGISKKRIRMDIRLPTKRKEPKNIKEIIEEIKEKLIKDGYKRISIYQYNDKREKILFVSTICSKTLCMVLSKILENIHNLIDKSSDDVKKAYIAGFFSAEGSIAKPKYQKSRALNVSQKDINELIFLKKLFIDLGFSRVRGPEKCRHAYRLITTYQHDIKKFHNEIGFGHHKSRNEKLKQFAESYIHDPKPLKERFDEIINILLKNGNSITAPFLTSNLNVDYKHTSYLLKLMEKKGFLKVNRVSKPYIYKVINIENRENKV